MLLHKQKQPTTIAVPSRDSGFMSFGVIRASSKEEGRVHEVSMEIKD